MRFSVLISATFLAVCALAAPLPLASSDTGVTTFLTARAVTTPLAKLAESKLSAEAALGLKKLKTKTAVANLNKLGLRLTPGATLAKLLSEAEKGSNSANAALKKAVDEAAEHMVFSETGDEVIRKIVFDQYRHNGGIKPISRTSRLWNSIKGWWAR